MTLAKRLSATAAIPQQPRGELQRDGAFVRRMRDKCAKADEISRAGAARQHGVVTYCAAARARICEARCRRSRAGRAAPSCPSRRLRRQALGLSRGGRYMAAVLAVGDGAVLSHLSAAVLWGWCRRRRTRTGSMSRYPAPTAGVAASASPSTAPRSRRATSAAGGIPLTTPTARSSTSAAAARSAEAPPQGDLSGPAPPLPPRPAPQGRPHPQRPREGLPRLRPPPPPAARRDQRPRRRLHRRLPLAPRRLVVETDSYESTTASIAFEDDHERDLKLRQRGLAVLRYTGRQLEREPAASPPRSAPASPRRVASRERRRPRALPDRRQQPGLPGFLRPARVDRDQRRPPDQRDLRARLDAGQDHRRAPSGRVVVAWDAGCLGPRRDLRPLQGEPQIPPRPAA